MFEAFKELQHHDTIETYETRKKAAKNIFIEKAIKEAEREFEELYPKYESNL